MSAQIELVVSNAEPTIDPESRLGYALRYAALGWHIFPLWNVKADGQCACGELDCSNSGKHPLYKLAPKGQDNATTDVSIIKKWWNSYPDANIAAHLASSNLCAIDIDPRNGGMYTIETIEAEHGPLISDVLQYTGGGGEHRIFQLPANQTLPGKLGKGIDVKANGYIVLEPSNHFSGGAYTWEASSDPLNGAIASPLPDWLRDLARTKMVFADDAVSPAIPLSDGELVELEAALAFISSDDRDTWYQIGMALQNDLGGGAGFDLWCDWSQRSDKYDYKDQLKVWNSFKRKGLSGITKATIFKMAMEAGWVNKPVISQTTWSPELLYIKLDTPIYSDVERLPGVLGEIQDYYNATAKIPQPAFAAQTALGIVSVMLGRRFKTVFDDYASLYFLNIAPTACGKEHIKRVTEDVLKACEMEKLLAGDGYTSAGAVLSTLNTKPVHISVIDELGMYLEASNSKSNFIGKSANTTLMECIGRLGGDIRSKNYSTLGSSKNTEGSLTIKNPAITIQSMTTPSTFYSNLTVDMIKDGFFGRFITCKSNLPRLAPKKTRPLNVPLSIINWAKAINDRAREHDPASCSLNSPEVTGEVIVIDETEGAENRLTAFAEKMVALMNELEAEGLEGCIGRYGEFSGRLSLLIALAVNPFATTIEEAQATIAVRYMDKLSIDVVNDVKENIVSSEFQQAKHDVLAAIRNKKDGYTERDMHRVAPFTKFKEKDIGDVIQSLLKAELIALVNTREGKPGKPRNVFMAINSQGNDELT